MRVPSKLHRSRFCCAAVAIVILLGLPAGCALWNPEVWNLDRYRDERSLDIEKHLSREKPIVANPF
jgi:hypothetical protein